MSLSPLAVIISGFHGNTDPVFVMFLLLATFMLTRFGNGFAAGVAFGLAVSVKIVPIVAIGVLGVIAWRLGRPVFRRFVAGGMLIFGLLWFPVLVSHPSEFVRHYLGYAGISLRQWGLSQFLDWATVPLDVVVGLGGDARFAIVALATVVPAVLAWRRPPVWGIRYVGLAMGILLLLSPAFSTQYLVWALAPGLLIGRVRDAVPFVAGASCYLLVVYSGWCQAPPWAWNEAVATPVPAIVLPLMVATWLALAHLIWTGISQPIPALHRLTDFKGELHAPR